MRDISPFLDRLRQWASGQSHIVAVALVGSFARGSARVDSDVDIVLLSDQPSMLLNDDQWLNVFGTVARSENEDWGLVQSRRVFYADGLEVEFGVTVHTWAAINPVDAETRRVISDGAKIISDPHGILAALVNAISKV